MDEVSAGGAVARSSADAPEIDGVVRMEEASKLKPGDWAQVKILSSDAHDLRARLVPGKAKRSVAGASFMKQGDFHGAT